MEENLRKYIDELIQEVEQELDEATTTAGVDGYQTPFAFGGGRDKDKKKQKKNIDVTGYTKVKDIDESINEAELKLGVKYVNKQGKEGFIQTGGSKNSKDWFWFDGKTKHPYDKVKKELKPSKDQKKTGFGDYLKQGGRVWDNVNPTDSPSVNESYKGRKDTKFKPEVTSDVKKALELIKKGFYLVDNNTALEHKKGGYVNLSKRVTNYFNKIKESVNEAKVKRPVNRWLELKNDDTMHPHKKMAHGLKELKYQLAETEKFFKWYNKIKNINELESSNYWKRTQSHIYKIKERLVNIARTIQEIEK